MLKILLPLALLGVAFTGFAQEDCGFGESYAELNINNIQAGLRSSGVFWNNGLSARYFAPKPDDGTEGVSPFFIGGLWIAAKNEDQNIQVAAQRYAGFSGGYTDFFPGPLDATTGTPIENACFQWDKHFTVLRSEIEAHLVDFEDNGIIDTPLPAIFSWPSRGNPNFENYYDFELPLQNLAPFVDKNGNGIYEPAEGEYPLVKGDQAVWWVFNDAAAQHTSTYGDSLGVEVQVMAYAFQSFEEAIDNTTFYEMKFINRGSEILYDFQSALWLDNDFGCYEDDAFGIDTTRSLAFYYNRDEFDGDEEDVTCSGVPSYGSELPLVGIKLIQDSDGSGVTSFTWHLSSSPNGPGYLGPPNAPNQYWACMNGRWRTGEYVTFGEYGIGGEIPTKFVFSGNPASSENEWSFCSASNYLSPAFQYNTVMSTACAHLPPGASRTQTYAVIFVEDVPHPCPDITPLQEAADIVQNFDCTISSIHPVRPTKEIGINIFPNPNTGTFFIELPEQQEVENLELIDVFGKQVHSYALDSTSRPYELNTTLPSGIYFVKVKTDEGLIGVSKIYMH